MTKAYYLSDRIPPKVSCRIKIDVWINCAYFLHNYKLISFLRAFPAYKAYETPVYFKSDWLNEFWDQRSDVADDYRFVYMGPKGSW